ncbi:MAG: hypothetical protein WAO52_15325 [Prolixibacteraceae bacterium]
MLKKNLPLILILMIFTVSLTAKVKEVPLKNFKSADIGNPAISGTTDITNDGITLIAGGADVWGTRDEFRYAWLEQSGDFDLSARIENLTDPHLYTKAGIMAREELSDNSSHIYFQVFPNNLARNKNNGGYEFQYRKVKDGEMKAIYPASFEGTPEFPVNYPNTWIRLKRSGDEFTGFYSTDGKTWKVYSAFTMKLAKKIYLGLAVTSHDTAKTATATFKNITISNK